MDYLLHIQNKNLLFHFSYIDISPMSKGVTLSFPVLSSLQKRKKKKKTQNQVFTFSTKPQNLCIITLITIPIYILPTKKKKESLFLYSLLLHLHRPPQSSPSHLSYYFSTFSNFIFYLYVQTLKKGKTNTAG